MDVVARSLKDAECRLKDINEVISKGDSEIQKFYQDSVVFVTGASGFMGKLLLEKLLRACNVKKIYILIRVKKGKTFRDRLNDITRDPVFDYLREMQPNFGDKIVPVEGDVSEIRLGISEHDWVTLTEDVDIMFHLAATTKFDMPLPAATLINIRGTREILHLAKECPKLRVFVYVSTAYCRATTDKIGVQLDEEFHPCPIPPATLIELVEKVDKTRVTAMEPGLIESWPNTYSFTKAVAEELVRSIADEIPVCIARPPIVIGSYSEPAPGWVDMNCMYGPSGSVLGFGLGLVHLVYGNEDSLLSLVPGDHANNSILAAAWDCAERRKAGDKDVKIFTVSSTKCGVQLGTVSKNVQHEDIKKYVPRQSVGYCKTYVIQNKLLYRILSWFLHYIPAMIVDLIMNVFNISRPEGVSSFMNMYKKVDKVTFVYNYFLNNGWRFNDKNVVELQQKMSPTDQKIFNMDTSTVYWDQMIFIWSLGIKKFILKEFKLIDNYAIRKQKVFKVAYYAVFFIYLLILYDIFYSLYRGFKLFPKFQ